MNPGNNPDYDRATSIYNFKVQNLHGEYVGLEGYKNHVCIIANVASQCPLAVMHYKQFDELMDKFGDLKGLRILAFPCSQFTVDETTEDTKYKFHVFGKVQVNGESASPLWKYLKLKQNGGKGSFIKWNFTKFIINKLGVPVDRFDSGVQPLELVKVLDCYW